MSNFYEKTIICVDCNVEFERTHSNQKRCKSCTKPNKWKKEHPEIARELSRKYRKKHRERILTALRKWQKANPGGASKWRRENPDKFISAKRKGKYVLYAKGLSKGNQARCGASPYPYLVTSQTGLLKGAKFPSNIQALGSLLYELRLL